MMKTFLDVALLIVWRASNSCRISSEPLIRTPSNIVNTIDWRLNSRESFKSDQLRLIRIGKGQGSWRERNDPENRASSLARLSPRVFWPPRSFLFSVSCKAGTIFRPSTYPGPGAAVANGPTPPMDDCTHENPFDPRRESFALFFWEKKNRGKSSNLSRVPVTPRPKRNICLAKTKFLLTRSEDL